MFQITRIITATLVLSAAGIGLYGCGGSSEKDVAKHLTYTQYCQLPTAQANAPVLPEPRGRVCLGKASYQVIDTTRSQINADGKISPRELSIKVWYPMESTSGGKRSDYMNAKISAHVKTTLSQALGIDLNNASDLQTHTKEGGKPLTKNSYPLVLLSPGRSAVVEQYSSLAEDLASHGVVVVGVDHPYISGPTFLNNGQVAFTAKEPEFATIDEATIAQIIAHNTAEQAILTADLRSVLDWLQLPGRIGSRLDFSRVAAFGHSYGGAAAWLSSRSDPRVHAAINMDGTVTAASNGIFPKPIRFLGSAASAELDETIDAALKGATAASGRVVIPGTGHLDFSDFKLLLNFHAPNTTVKELEAMDLGAGSATKILETVRTEVWDFFRQHLRL